MKPEIEKACKKWAEAETEFRAELEKLESYGLICECEDDDRDTTLLTHYGKYPELTEVCLSCGGMREQ